MKSSRFTHILLVLVAIIAVALAAKTEPVKPIDSLDLPRYMGVWYEISRFDNAFQKQCVGNTSATYSLVDGKVKVVNSCQTKSGEMTSAVGVGRQNGPSDSAKLEVTFAPSWIQWLPFVWADYWVLDLDEDYSLVAVGGPSREFLWILSRTPQVDPIEYKALVNRLDQMAFDTSKLILTPQLIQDKKQIVTLLKQALNDINVVT